MKTRNEIIILIGTLCAIALIYALIYWFGVLPPDKFGQIGDSVGGIVTPIFSLFAAYFAYKAYLKEKRQFNLLENQYREEKKELSRKDQIEEVADMFAYFEERISKLKYKARDGSDNKEEIAIQKLIYDLNNITNVSNMMYTPIIKSLEACNKIFVTAYDFTMKFRGAEREKRLLVWELVLLYDSYLRINYEIYNLDDIFNKAINYLKELKAGPTSDPESLRADFIEDLYKSIKDAKKTYATLEKEHRM